MYICIQGATALVFLNVKTTLYFFFNHSKIDGSLDGFLKKGISKAFFFFCCCYFCFEEAIMLSIPLAQENENRIMTKKYSQLQWILTVFL